MVTIVIRKNLVKKAAGVSVACALTIGMNVVIAGPEESALFQQMGLIKTAAGAEVTMLQSLRQLHRHQYLLIIRNV
jgi:hypothetical protein